MIRAMIAALAASLAVSLIASPALAQRSTLLVGQGDRVTPFGEKGVYALDPVLNYLTTYGLTKRHDLQEVANGGSIGIVSGSAQLQSGTSADGNALLTAVKPGIYAAGRSAEAGQAIMPVTLPATNSTAYMRWGAWAEDTAGNIENGFYWQIYDEDSDGNLEFCFAYVNEGAINESCGLQRVNGEPVREPGAGFNGEALPDDFDPFTESFVAVADFNHYGVGGTSHRLYYSVSAGTHTLNEWQSGSFGPASGESFADPNLYMRQEVDAGNSGANVEMRVTGRRYDTTGKDELDSRTSGDFRLGLTLQDGTLDAVLCARRKAEWPAGSGRENTVTALASTAQLVTSGSAVYYIAAVDGVSGGTWAEATNKPAGETALEFNTGVTGFGSVQFISRPVPAISGQGNQSALSGEHFLDFPLRGTEPMCLLAQGQGGTPTVDGYLTFIERM